MCPHFKEGEGGGNASTLTQGDKGDRHLRLGGGGDTGVVLKIYMDGTCRSTSPRAPIIPVEPGKDAVSSSAGLNCNPHHISSAKMNAVRTALAPQAETPQATLYCCSKSWGDRMEGTWVIK